jgi:Zn-dependent peptidase ImmA (M78 family)
MNKPNQRQLAMKALQQAERTRSQAGIPTLAPVNPIDVSMSIGCPVRMLNLPSLEGIYSIDPSPTIIVGAQRPAGRRSYTCAHELGHHIFGHGTQIEQLIEHRAHDIKSDSEYLADMFAAFFLMSQLAVTNTIKLRGWGRDGISPKNIFSLACYFGVGYSSIVYHLSRTLKILDAANAQELLAVAPKEIKTTYNAPADTEVIIVDHHWQHRTADLEVGDSLVVSENVRIDNPQRLGHSHSVAKENVYVARAPGHARAYDENKNWAVNIRISRKGYEGLAEYRHLEDEEYK